MQLDSFLLADAATPAGGKLYIHGGGITRINVPEVPFMLPTLAVVVRLLVGPDEAAIEHVLQLGLSDPAGEPVIPAASVPIPAEGTQLDAADGEERFVQLALGFIGIVFHRVGIHRLSMSLDGELIRTMTMPVVLLPQPE
jgi:hypothetical protein